MSEYQEYLDCKHKWVESAWRGQIECRNCGIIPEGWNWVQQIVALEAQRNELLAVCEEIAVFLAELHSEKMRVVLSELRDWFPWSEYGELDEALSKRLHAAIAKAGGRER